MRTGKRSAGRHQKPRPPKRSVALPFFSRASRAAKPRPAAGVKLKFWQRTYLATLALFVACVGAVFGIAYTVARQQSYTAQVNALLEQQHYLLQTLARDIVALNARNSTALPALYQYYGQQYSPEGLYIELYSAASEPADYSSVPESCAATGQRIELSVQPGQRIYLVRRTAAGRRLFSATGLDDPLFGFVVVCSADMERFYVQWEGIARLFWLSGLGIGAIFAVLLYVVLGRLYQPLAQVTATANQLAAGQRTARAPVTRQDEFGALAQSLNGLADTVEEQLTQLQAVADQRQRLIENLSHEIRTPLAAISGWAETLQAADLPQDEQSDALQTILFESNRILSLSRQMLELSVLRHDETIALSPVALPPLLARLETVLKPKATERQVSLRIDPPGFATLPGNEALLESLLLNLADNAVKACAPGGCVRVTAASTPRGPQIRIQDNGHGMTAETLKNLGQPFYREDKSRSRREGGAGLGVALCVEIARQHGATLTYRSAPNQGTTATLCFYHSYTSLGQRQDKPLLN